MTRRTKSITLTITLLAAASVISCSNAEYDPFQPVGVGGKADETSQSNLQAYTAIVQACAANLGADAADCFARANENEEVKQRIVAGLTETRQLMANMYDPSLVDEIVPTDEQAFRDLSLLTRTAAAACDRSHDADKARCQIVAQAALSFLYVKWVVDYSAQLDEVIKGVVPESPRLKDCRDRRDAAMNREGGISQNEMNDVETEMGDCAAKANDTFVKTTVNSAQAIASLNGLREAAGKVCNVLVNASDSATGSISRFYFLGCRSDAETFLATSLDWML